MKKLGNFNEKKKLRNNKKKETRSTKAVARTSEGGSYIMQKFKRDGL